MVGRYIHVFAKPSTIALARVEKILPGRICPLTWDVVDKSNFLQTILRKALDSDTLGGADGERFGQSGDSRGFSVHYLSHCENRLGVP